MSKQEKTDEVDIFAEMEPHMVHGPEIDDSREAIYTRLEGEGLIPELEKRLASADKDPATGEAWESVYQRLSKKTQE